MTTGDFMKYVYPAIFVPLNEEHFQGYGVEFPDFENSFTEGVDLYDALYMAEDLLNLELMSMEDDNEKIPAPSNFKNIKLEDGAFVNLIKANTDYYRRYLEAMKEYREENPSNENDEDDDRYISDWLASRICKAAGIEPPNE